MVDINSANSSTSLAANAETTWGADFTVSSSKAALSTVAIAGHFGSKDAAVAANAGTNLGTDFTVTSSKAALVIAGPLGSEDAAVAANAGTLNLSGAPIAANAATFSIIGTIAPLTSSPIAITLSENATINIQCPTTLGIVHMNKGSTFISSSDLCQIASLVVEDGATIVVSEGQTVIDSATGYINLDAQVSQDASLVISNVIGEIPHE